MVKNKNKGSKGISLLSTPVSSSHEFEGLAGFEEISACTLMKVNRFGKVKREVWENGKIMKQNKQSNSTQDEKLESSNMAAKVNKKKKKKKKKNLKKVATGSDSLELKDSTDSTDKKTDNEHKRDNSSVAKDQLKEEQKPKKGKKRRKKQSPKDEVATKKKRYDSASFQGKGLTKDVKVDVSEWKKVFAPPPVLDALAELGFTSPTEIQKLVLPAAIRGRKDIIGAAETGSGKTLAFAIPIIHGILEDKKHENVVGNTDDEDIEENMEEEESDIELEQKEFIEEKENCEKESDDDKEDNTESLEDLEDTKCESSGENKDVLLHDSDSGNQSDEDFDDNDKQNQENISGLGCVRVIDDVDFDFLEGDAISSIKTSKKKLKKLRALIVTPTRELAIQVKSHLCAVLKYTDIRAVVVVGGVAAEKQERLLRTGPDIVVGTPGRLWELIQQNNDHLNQISDIRYLAIDETDRMVERGHFQELTELLEMINSNEEAKDKRQTFVFSATLSTVHDIPKRLKIKQKIEKMTPELKINKLAKLIGVKTNPKVVDVTRKFGTAASLTEARINCLKDEKDYYLYYFLKCYPGRTLLFCNSIDCVRRLQNLFTLLQCHPQSLHASMHQKQRLKSLEQFSSNPRALLLATDVAARGLDIPNIQHVIHYQVPRTAETYIHRSGRTARATQEGLSILLIESSEVRKYRQMCNTLNRDCDLPPFPVDIGILGQVKKIVNCGRTVEKMEHTLRKNHAKEDWFRRAAEEAEILLDEDELDDDEEREKSMKAAQQKRDLQEKKYNLMKMLASPLLTSDFSGKYPTQTGMLVMPHLTSTAVAGNNSGEVMSNALSVMKKESEEFSKLVKKVKIRTPVKKINKKKFKGFDKRKKRLQKEKEEFLKNSQECE